MELDKINEGAHLGTPKEEKGAIGAIIVAAGKGARMGLGYNKVLASLGGMPVLCRTLKAFLESGMIDQLVLVISPDDEEAIGVMLKAYDMEENVTLVHGGSSRQESVYHGLLKMRSNVEIVLIHDGARPFIDDGIISRSIASTRSFGAACAGMPVKDTIKKVDKDGTIVETPDRSGLWSAQTPQSFKRDIIMEAHLKALESHFAGTDDAMLVESLGIPVRMFEGSYRNIKITSTEDLIIAEGLVLP